MLCVYMKKAPDIKDIFDLPMLSIDMENKENGSLDTENNTSHGRGYNRTYDLSRSCCLSLIWEIDGKSLLLMTRNDVLTGLSLKLGPALKIYEYHVKPLQTQHLKSSSL
ncbi:sterile alpha motif domain-containing protein 13 isoform X3 [Rhineura floridana]|uniref:sterile alpha motif domain-containing protein 13 isoform X3 n=1 Tax=Rhineura floridana TaxID=261503 RepID=UPI002AC811CD|nr:sterile alpha motif domain-containing protein 13 isoform X3 [Rhineura floridana]